ncbi:MAG: beta strand repeat-containing protein [Prosthecobacter sp.]|uniref:beta strand repeat-containing protein n=1 Tax=Prosthecobacter sp. TaxID=1965333 RepID=UPI0038FE7AE0
MKTTHRLLTLACLLLPALTGQAANQTWIGGSLIDGNWSSGGNWSGGAAPGSTSVTNSPDIATFNAAIANGWGTLATPIVIDSTTQNIFGLTFTGAAGSYVIGTTGGNALRLSSTGTIQIASGLTATNVIQTINAPLSLRGTTYTFRNDSASGTGAGSGTLVIGGAIFGATGATTLTLTGSNTNANTLSGSISNGTATSVGVTKTEAGTWVLTGASTYTGATSISGGTLTLAFGTVSSGIISSSSALTMSGGTLQLTGTGTQTFNGLTTNTNTGSRILLGSAQTLTLGALTSAGTNSALNFHTAAGGASGATVGTGLVVLTGQTAGNVINSGFTVTDSTGYGLATVNASNQVIRKTDTALLPASGAVLGTHYQIGNNAGGTGAAGSSTLAITASQTAGSITVDTTAAAGAVTLGSGVLLDTSTWNFGGSTSSTNPWSISGNTSGAGLRAAGNNGAIQINNFATGTITFTAPILAFGTNPVTLKGSGTTVFAGVNTYTGATTINGGTLRLTDAGALADTTAVNVSGAAAIFDISAISAAGETVGSLAGAAGSSVLLGGKTLTAGGDNTDTTFAGVLSGTGGSLTKAGTGTLTLTSASTYTGTTTISAGTLQLGFQGTTGSLATTSAITNNGTLAFSRIDTVTQGTDFATVISGTGAVTKLFTNTLVLNGANTYAGLTTVSQGVLNIRHAEALGSTDAGTTVSAGAALQLQGGISVGAEALSLNGNGISTTGALRNISGDNSYGGAITLAGNTRINSDAGLLTLSTITGTNRALTVGGAGNTTVQGIISTGTGALTKDGTGTLTLTAANTYTGSTTISAGTLSLSGAGALADTTAVNVSGAAAIFDISAISAAGETVGSLAGNAGSSVVLGGKNLTLGADTTTTFVGVLSGTGGSLTKAGTGILILTGANTYTGTTTISAGTLGIGNGTTTGSLSVLSPITNNGTLTFDRSNTVTQGTDFGPVISGTGAVTKNGTGTLVLNGANTYAGLTTVSVGVLNIRHAEALGTTAGGTTVSSSGALQLQGGIAVGAEALTLTGNGISSTGALRNLSGDNTFAGAITLTGNTRINSDAGLLTLSSITGTNRFLTVGGTGNTTIQGIIGTGTGTLTKDGTGTLTLTAANTYTGLTTISAGALNIRHADALGTTAAGTSITSGAALQLQGGITTAAEALTLNGTGVSSTGALRNISGDNTFAGAITLGNATRINSDAGLLTLSSNLASSQALTVGGAGNTTIQGIISTGTPLTKDGSGTLTLTAANTYTGGTTISAGTLILSGAGALADTTAVNVAGTTAIFDLSAISAAGETIASLAGAAGSSVVLGGKTLTAGGANTSTTFAGVLSGTGGSLTKAGTGILRLNGASTYTGATTISAGTLQIGNGSTTGSLSVLSSITNNGTLTFNRSDTVTQGSDFAPFISGTGAVTQNGTGTLVLNGANTYTGRTTVNGGTLTLAFGTVSSDIISSSSALTLGGGTLQLTGSGSQTFAGLITTASTGSRILLGSAQTLTLGALDDIGSNSALNFHTAAGGASGATVGTGLVVLTGQTAGNVINGGFTVTDSTGYGLATVNGSDQVIRLTGANLLPASGAVVGTPYQIDNNNGGTGAAGSSTLAITTSQAAASITVDTTAAAGAVTLDSGAVLDTSTWNFGGSASSTNPWSISGSAGGRASARRPPVRRS